MAIRINNDGTEVCTTAYSWFKRREEACERASYQCEGCGKHLPIWEGHAHHKNGTRGLGGGKRDDRLSNLAWLCSWCHDKTHELARMVS